MSDSEDFEFYENPENQRLSGTPRPRKQGRVLTSHVPVRFKPEVIAQVKILADRDGRSVSAWIRRCVEEVVERELQPETHTNALAIQVLLQELVNAQADSESAVEPNRPAPTWDLIAS